MLRRMRLESNHQHLLLATAGALSAHLLLFLFAYWGINQISIPSDVRRVTVLTLESTPLDSIKFEQSHAVDTLNDAQTGQMQSMLPRPEPSELSQLTLQPVPEPAVDMEPQQNLELTSATTEVNQFMPENALPEPAQPTTVAAADLANNASSSKPKDDRVVALKPTEQTTEQPLLTSASSELAVSADPDPPKSEVGAKISVNEVQKRMLDQKIKKWAARIDASEQLEESVSWQHKGQTYVAKFNRLPASGEMDMDKMVVEVVTEHNGKRLTTVMRMKKLAFSNFAQFVHQWDPEVSMHDDEMDGRFHSNSRINLDFDRDTRPVFHGPVTTASYGVGFDRFARKGTRKQIFQGGLETGVKKIRMPRPRLLFNESQTIEGENTDIFVEDTRIVFLPDGRYTTQSLGIEDIPQTRIIGDMPVYLRAAPGTTLHISGTVKGKVMVYSPLRIVIEGDLLYSKENSETGENILGLVSDHDIVVAGAEVTGPGDLQINASIYARHRFAVRDYSEEHTGTLHLYGSLSAGSITATEPRYATRIVFDKRFESMRPPGFPVTDRYELATPDYDWQITPLQSPEASYD